MTLEIPVGKWVIERETATRYRVYFQLADATATATFHQVFWSESEAYATWLIDLLNDLHRQEIAGEPN